MFVNCVFLAYIYTGCGGIEVAVADGKMLFDKLLDDEANSPRRACRLLEPVRTIDFCVPGVVAGAAAALTREVSLVASPAAALPAAALLPSAPQVWSRQVSKDSVFSRQVSPALTPRSG